MDRRVLSQMLFMSFVIGNNVDIIIVRRRSLWLQEQVLHLVFVRQSNELTFNQ